MTRWTPADGPIEDALKDLPDKHPVILTWQGTTTTTAQAIRHLGADTCISAEWGTPAPQWDGALVVVDRSYNDPWVRYPDGHYHFRDALPVTASELEAAYGPCRVLIDADGNYPGTDPCNRGACAAPLGHEGTCAEASGWETTDD